jgi:hypothetical protein
MRRDELCALVDASDAFDPHSAANVGIDLARLLWVRCGRSLHSPEREKGHQSIGSSFKVKSLDRRFDHPITRSSDPLEQALKATDLLLQAGGFGLVVLDLADISIPAARRIPLTTWFRFRRVIENTSTALVVIEQQPHAKTCASLVLDLTAQQANWSETAEQGTPVGTHFGEGTAPLFRVNSSGVALPFGNPVASSFELPQRWNTPHARLLNSVHVHLQVTRSRGISPGEKFPAQPASMFHEAGIEIRRTALAVNAKAKKEKQTSLASFGTSKSPDPALFHSSLPGLRVP